MSATVVEQGARDSIQLAIKSLEAARDAATPLEMAGLIAEAGDFLIDAVQIQQNSLG